MRKLIWLLAVAATLLVSCGTYHFITDPGYRNRVRSTLAEILLKYGVMAAPEILALLVAVRIRLPQQLNNNRRDSSAG